MSAVRRPRLRVARVGLVLLCAGVVTTLVPQIVAGASGPRWAVSAAFPPPVSDLKAVACFSATGCIAVGYTADASGQSFQPIELRTVDSGALWTPVTLPRDNSQLFAAACVALTCEAGGSNSTMLRSVDGGVTWTTVSLPPTLSSVAGIACPSAAVCFAYGDGPASAANGAIAGSTDGGATWSSQFTESTARLTSLWCVTATRCFAYAATFVSTSNGTTWAPFSAPVNFPAVATCPTPTACVGTASGVVTTSDAGLTWTITDPSHHPTALACVTATSCVALDPLSHGLQPNLMATSDGGVTWSVQSLPTASSVLGGIACGSAGNCQVAGYADADGFSDRALLVRVATGTAQFVTEPVGNAVDSISTISCATPNVCDAVGADPYSNPVLLRTTSSGAAWAPLALPVSLSFVDRAVCLSASTCLVVGGTTVRGSVWRTTDGGATFSAAGVPRSVQEVVDVSCVGASTCHGVGYLTNNWTTIVTSRNGGRSWSAAPVSHAVGDLNAIDCTTALDCVAVGDANDGLTGAALYTVDGGAHWKPGRLPGGVEIINGVSCVAAMTCLGAAEENLGSNATLRGAVVKTVNGGQTWSVLTAVGAAATLFDVSCWSATACETTGVNTGVIHHGATNVAVALRTSNAGRSWTAQGLPPDEYSLVTVSCSRVGVCFSGGNAFYSPGNPPVGASILRLP